MSNGRSSLLHFGAFETELATGELRRNGRTVKLQPQPSKVLALLLERPGEMVTREEIRQRLWGDTSVDFEQGLNFAIKKIRDALGDDADRPRYIETLPRRGYRFIAPVERVGNLTAQREGSRQPATSPENWATSIAEGLGPSHKAARVEGAGAGAGVLAIAEPPDFEVSPGGSAAEPAVDAGASGSRKDEEHGHEPVLSETKDARATVRRRWALALAVVVALIVVLVAVWLFTGRRGQSTGPLRIAPFTGLTGLEGYPAFSPDGKQLAYVWDGGSGTTQAPATAHPLGHIYVKLIGAGAPLQLTHGPLFDQDPAWSPDGRYVAFIRNWSSPNNTTEVISIPALGGPERRLAEIYGQPPGRDLAWSPDGESVVTNTASDAGLFLISTENGEKRRLTSPPKGPWSTWDTDPAFSPDGRTLAFVRRTGLYVCDIYLQKVNTAEARRLTFDKAMIWGLAWTPNGRDILFSSKRAGFATLWKIAASGGEIEPVTGVGGNAFFPTVSPRGNLLAYANQELNVNIWRIQIAPSGRAHGSPRRIISGSGLQVDDEISPDGKRVVFASDRSGDKEIWVANIDGSNPLQLTSLHAPLTGSPRWSPDGRWIAFDSHVSEHGGAFVVSAQGGTPRRLTPLSIEALVPSWSHDGKSIYFSGDAEENWGIWKMRAHGGDAVRVADGFGCRESDDGKWLYSGKFLRDGKTAILRTPVGGGPETLVLSNVTRQLWTLAGSCLYFMDEDAKLHATVNCLNVATRRNARIADVEKEPFVVLPWAGLSVSPGGGSIIYPQLDEQISRIMLVENVHW